MHAMTELAGYWDGRGAGYFNTASYGLPPRAAVTAATGWIEQWTYGAAPLGSWLGATEQARTSFAALVGVDPADVATGTSVSQLASIVAAALPERSTVIASEDEFSSLLFPFLSQADRGVKVDLVRRDLLAETITERGDAVVFSLVHSADGALADHAAIRRAAASRGALTIVDAAQACGWLDADYAGFDFVVCPAFKWLYSPRGTAFLTVRPDLLDRLRPSGAGWWSSPSASHFFGGPLDLDPAARRLDVSPVWNSWGATAAALDTVLDLGADRIARHVLDLADQLRRWLDLPPGTTPIVCVPRPDAADLLQAAGLAVSRTPSGARLAIGPYTTVSDLDRVLEALHVR